MIPSQQITTISIVDFDGFANQWFAFTQMGILPLFLKANGLQTFKLMGSGANDGFGAKPNFGRYALLAIWDNEDFATEFFNGNKAWKSYLQKSTGQKTYFLKNTMAHGAWNGVNPFEKSGEHDPNEKVAVITRATIKWRHMLRFWRNVPESSNDILRQEGVIFAIGIGEMPLRFQATFSIWENSEFMKKFAYKSKQHTDMITKTKKIGWYKEELFSRFKVVER
jgi:heme-degrading monooxygenase HmoA